MISGGGSVDEAEFLIPLAAILCFGTKRNCHCYATSAGRNLTGMWTEGSVGEEGCV